MIVFELFMNTKWSLEALLFKVLPPDMDDCTLYLLIVQLSWSSLLVVKQHTGINLN